MLSRREVVAAAAGALAPKDAYDAGLEKVHRTAPEYAGGLSNHAPMAMDALVAGGRADRVASWADAYLAKMPAAAGKPPDLERYATGKAKDVLNREWPLLVTGWSSAGWHGVIRTAHAVRALHRAETPARRAELAHALAYWARSHTPLPGGVGGNGKLGIDAALSRIPVVPKDQRKSGLIGTVLSSVDGRPDFAAALAEVDLDSPKDPLSQLTAAAARMFVNAGGRSFTLLHAVTGTAALRPLQPWLDAKNFRSGLAAAFHAIAAARAAEGAELGMPARTKTSADALLERGLASDDEHSIKLVEACIREHRISGAPELLSAAQAWLNSD